MVSSAIYITGHKNPDTDSICSALAYANLKQTLGENAIGIRIGEVNNETRFVLDYFQEDAPPLVYDIRTRVRDIEFDDAVTIGPDGMLHEAIKIMRANKKKVIVIVNEKRHLLGMATISDITNTIVNETKEKDDLIRQTPISNFATILKGRLVYEPEVHHMNGRIFIASFLGMERDYKDYKDRIVITSARRETQLRAVSSGAAVIIATGMEYPNPEVVEACKKAGCAYIITQKDMYQTAQLVQQAIPLSLIMTQNLTAFHFNDYVEDVKVAINRSRFRSYPVLDHLGCLVGLISRYHLFKHANRKLVLVDHNEMEQSINGAPQAEIIEIVDHHRIGGIKTTSPVMFRNELVGCCCTIIAKLYGEKNVEIPKSMAGLMLGAIISDTLYFNSPTCTSQDIEMAKYLAGIAEVDLDSFALQVLAASASIKEKTIEEIVYNDLKIFEIEKYKVALGQINIMSIDDILPIREQIQEYLDNFTKSNNFGICVMIFSVVDGSGSYLISSGSALFIANAAFADIGEHCDGYLFLKEVMSRKKQIVPLLTEAAKNYRSNYHA